MIQGAFLWSENIKKPWVDLYRDVARNEPPGHMGAAPRRFANEVFQSGLKSLMRKGSFE